MAVNAGLYTRVTSRNWNTILEAIIRPYKIGPPEKS
jgi:hypothetical protein